MKDLNIETGQMMKYSLIIISLLLAAGNIAGQNTQTGQIKREITLYNPYKPNIPDVAKRSFLPDMNDTARITPEFTYDVTTYPFMPPYNLSPLRPASILPDMLPKLYKSYVKAGMGNYYTPFAEVSISTERSKKGAAGIYARHFSTNGKVELQNNEKVFAGYMDNDAVLYGKKFFKKSVLGGAVDFAQRTRYPYGYDTTFTDYSPEKKEIKTNYYNTGAELSLSSMLLDSSKLWYDAKLRYDLFMSGNDFRQHTFGLKSEFRRNIGSFYAGTGFEFDYMAAPDTVSNTSKYFTQISPYIIKSGAAWHAKLGLIMVLDKGFDKDAGFHIYPDLRFGFNIVPSYLGFYASLSGRMERNEPFRVVGINPYLIPGNAIYTIPNTDYSVVVKAGLTGETGIDGIYDISASYSMADNFLLFSNITVTNGAEIKERGNHFLPLTDQVEILNIHAETSGRLNNKFTFETGGNFWNYTLSDNKYAWNMPDWDGFFRLKYNLRDKILARAGVNLTGKRKLLALTIDESSAPPGGSSDIIDAPFHMNLSLGGEYRYTKILSFWFRFDNIAFKDYYEWAYYPSQRLMFMAGFTYSL